MFFLQALFILCVLWAVLAALNINRFMRGSQWGLTWKRLARQTPPRPDLTPARPPPKALIAAQNRFELQGENQGAGYAAAFLLRSLGTPISGYEVYRKMDGRLPNGYVLPHALLEALRSRGFDAVLYRSSLAQLKTHVSDGIPVIVLLGDGVRWQHYVNVVGYDKGGLYLYDSAEPAGAAAYYNRRMTEDAFLDQWNNGAPFFQRACFVVRSACAPAGPRRPAENL